MEIRMDGRTALITGGSLGLGAAMAESFCAAGARVAILARRSEPLDATRAAIAQKTGGDIRGYVCDVSVAEQISDTYAQVEADLGPIDILVNNAGHAQVGRFEEITDEMWQADLDLKLFAAIRLARLAFPGMKQRNWGRIINLLNSMAKAPLPGSAPTSVTRAAGMALTKVMAGEGAPHNVLVNALMIGRIESDQIRRAYDQKPRDIDYREFLANAGKDLPMGRFGTAQECANLALFLCSDAASYVTGCAINMDGGLSQVV
ncbi:MAG: SDR family oxidoreductase [Gammaproteobacteria bacterium]|nr:MAG: SDR family oxidoreductase [Gammaproteobacteria bacterium]TDJ39383.1 MAG: SDR family oxidoreductase [Gammaproteobacteria bacterium]